VESTARHAQEVGFHVSPPIDAMTDPDQESHTHGTARIFPWIGETGATEELLVLLESTRP